MNTESAESCPRNDDEESQETEEVQEEIQTVEQNRRLKRRKTSKVPSTHVYEALSKLEKIQSAAICAAHKKETEFDIWAKSVAIQLNKMELNRALNLQLRLQTIISEERIAYENQKLQSQQSVGSQYQNNYEVVQSGKTYATLQNFQPSHQNQWTGLPEPSPTESVKSFVTNFTSESDGSVIVQCSNIDLE